MNHYVCIDPEKRKGKLERTFATNRKAARDVMCQNCVVGCKGPKESDYVTPGQLVFPFVLEE